MIDWNRLNELRGEIGAEDLAEVIAVFLDETDEVVATLLPGVSAAEAVEKLHFLKGSALNLGLSAFAEICAAGEASAAQQGAVDLAEIVAVYHASKAEFLANVARDAA